MFFQMDIITYLYPNTSADSAVSLLFKEAAGIRDTARDFVASRFKEFVELVLWFFCYRFTLCLCLMILYRHCYLAKLITTVLFQNKTSNCNRIL